MTEDNIYAAPQANLAIDPQNISVISDLKKQSTLLLFFYHSLL
jgi:hypothetical protein